MSLSGTGSAPVSLSTTALNFGVVAVGSASASQTVTVTNASAAAVAVNSIAITGDFADTTTCGSSIAARAVIALSTVTFTPAAGGHQNGNAHDQSFDRRAGRLAYRNRLQLSATGVLSLSPSTVTFNNGYTIGDNPSQTVTVTNTSAAAAGIAAIALSGDASLTQRNKCRNQPCGGRDVYHHGDVPTGGLWHLHQAP